MQKESQTYKIAPAVRLASVSEYYFSKKLKEVAQMNAEGKDVISLGIGSPDMPPSRETIETLCNNAHDPNGHGYQPYVGIPELRKGFANWYQRWYGVELNPNTEIQPLIGSKEGILHITLAFVNPGADTSRKILHVCFVYQVSHTHCLKCRDSLDCGCKGRPFNDYQQTYEGKIIRIS